MALRIAVRVALLGAAVALFLHFADIRSVGRALTQMSLSVFAAALALDAGFYIVESWRLSRLSLGRYPFGALWRSRMVSALLSNILPGMASAELLRIFLVDRTRPGNKLYVALLLIANRLYGVLALSSLFLLAFAADRGHLPAFVGAHLVALSSVCLAALPLPLLLRVRFVRVAMVVAIRRMRGRVKRIAYTVFNATAHFCDPRRWAIAVISSTVTNALVVLQFWVVGRAVGAGLSLTEWAVCVPVAAFASFLPIGFGSVGPQDATFVIVGRLTGHSIEQLLAVSVLMHVVQITSTLPGALFLGDTRAVIAEAVEAGRAVARTTRRQRR